MTRTRAFLADDHALLLDAFRKLLEAEHEIVGTAGDGRTLVEEARRLHPEIIVADIGMPRLNGLDACELLKKSLPRTRLIFLTVNEDPDIAEEAMRRGADGYLLKKSAASELFEAIDTVRAGRRYMTPLVSGATSSRADVPGPARGAHPVLSLRQREVLQLLAEGRLMKEAADSLHITPRTIAFHKYAIMRLLGVKSTAELVRYALEHGLVTGRDATPNAP